MSVALSRHELRVAEVRREAPDAVSVRFDVPDDATGAFRYSAGQYLTLCREFGGEELRRCYSICAKPGCGELWVGVREEDGGRFSGWLNRDARAGDRLSVLPPDGRFTFDPQDDARNLLLVAAGSGITPVLSILETALAETDDAAVTLIYANRDADHIMFRERLSDLKDRYLSRLRLFHILSRERSEVDLVDGRIDAAKCAQFFGEAGIAPAKGFDRAYLCGPEELMNTVAGSLSAYGLEKSQIRRELFLNENSPPPKPRDGAAPEPALEGAQVTVILDQRQRTLVFDPALGNILDAARAAGMDVPYACKAGVCATCRAHVSDGEVVMARNQALEEDELSRGFVLTCQSTPRTRSVVIDYDRRDG